MANRYWVGGAGDWTDTAHWSTTSGGSGGASVPGISDDVYFDGNSGGLASVTLPVGSTVQIQNFYYGTSGSPGLTSSLLVGSNSVIECSWFTWYSTYPYSVSGSIDVSIVDRGFASNLISNAGGAYIRKLTIGSGASVPTNVYTWNSAPSYYTMITNASQLRVDCVPNTVSLGHTIIGDASSSLHIESGTAEVKSFLVDPSIAATSMLSVYSGGSFSTNKPSITVIGATSYPFNTYDVWGAAPWLTREMGSLLAWNVPTGSNHFYTFSVDPGSSAPNDVTITQRILADTISFVGTSSGNAADVYSTQYVRFCETGTSFSTLTATVAYQIGASASTQASQRRVALLGGTGQATSGTTYARDPVTLSNSYGATFTVNRADLLNVTFSGSLTNSYSVGDLGGNTVPSGTLSTPETLYYVGVSGNPTQYIQIGWATSQGGTYSTHKFPLAQNTNVLLSSYVPGSNPLVVGQSCIGISSSAQTWGVPATKPTITGKVIFCGTNTQGNYDVNSNFGVLGTTALSAVFDSTSSSYYCEVFGGGTATLATGAKLPLVELPDATISVGSGATATCISIGRYYSPVTGTAPTVSVAGTLEVTSDSLTYDSGGQATSIASTGTLYFSGTFSAGGGTRQVGVTNSSGQIGTVKLGGTSAVNLTNMTIGTLTNNTASFPSAITQSAYSLTINNFDLNGASAGSKLSFNGNSHYIIATNITPIAVDYLSLTDSVVFNPGRLFAVNSTDNGGNTNWSFSQPIYGGFMALLT